MVSVTMVTHPLLTICRVLGTVRELIHVILTITHDAGNFIILVIKMSRPDLELVGSCSQGFLSYYPLTLSLIGQSPTYAHRAFKRKPDALG